MIAHWIEHFNSNRVADFSDWKQTFSTALLDAIQELFERFDKGLIPADDFAHFAKNLASLPLTDFDSEIQGKLNPVLTDLYQKEGNTQWASFLERKQRLERIPGKSREWVVGHVRAGKEVFRDEILAAGFVLEEEIKVEGFEENYFLRFRKK